MSSTPRNAVRPYSALPRELIKNLQGGVGIECNIDPTAVLWERPNKSKGPEQSWEVGAHDSVREPQSRSYSGDFEQKIRIERMAQRHLAHDTRVSLDCLRNSEKPVSERIFGGARFLKDLRDAVGYSRSATREVLIEIVKLSLKDGVNPLELPADLPAADFKRLPNTYSFGDALMSVLKGTQIIQSLDHMSFGLALWAAGAVEDNGGVGAGYVRDVISRNYRDILGSRCLLGSANGASSFEARSKISEEALRLGITVLSLTDPSPKFDLPVLRLAIANGSNLTAASAVSAMSRTISHLDDRYLGSPERKLEEIFKAVGERANRLEREVEAERPSRLYELRSVTEWNPEAFTYSPPRIDDLGPLQDVATKIFSQALRDYRISERDTEKFRTKLSELSVSTASNFLSPMIDEAIQRGELVVHTTQQSSWDTVRSGVERLKEQTLDRLNLPSTLRSLGARFGLSRMA